MPVHTKINHLDLNKMVVNQCGECQLPCSPRHDLSGTKMEDITFVGNTIMVNGENIHDRIPVYEH